MLPEEIMIDRLANAGTNMYEKIQMVRDMLIEEGADEKVVEDFYREADVKFLVFLDYLGNGMRYCLSTRKDLEVE